MFSFQRSDFHWLIDSAVTTPTLHLFSNQVSKNNDAVPDCIINVLHISAPISAHTTSARTRPSMRWGAIAAAAKTGHLGDCLT